MIQVTKQLLTDVKQKVMLDKGIYKAALDQGVPVAEWLENYWVEKGFEATEYFGKTLGERTALKAEARAKGIAPTPNAMELILTANGIKAFGAQTDTIGKFLGTPSIAPLFPEWIASQVYAGAIRASLAPKLVAEVVPIRGLEFKALILVDSEKARQLSPVNRGVEIPETTIKLSSASVKIGKFGRKIAFDYEVIALSPLNIYGRQLARIGDQIGVDETEEFLYIAINGDGNPNTALKASNTKTVTTANTVTRIEFMDFVSILPQPNAVTVGVGARANLLKIWDMLSSMNNPMPQWQMSGLPLPPMLRWDTSIVPSDKCLGFDKERAIEQLTVEGFDLTETDRIIDKQQVMTVVSRRTGYHTIDVDAIAALDMVP